MNDLSNVILVVSAREAVLPGATELQPATIEVHRATGMIKRVHSVQKTRADYASLPEDAFIELEDGQLLLPGLVDAVSMHYKADYRLSVLI